MKTMNERERQQKSNEYFVAESRQSSVWIVNMAFARMEL